MNSKYIEWAKRAAKELGWLPEVIYSQWALETGWFKSNNFLTNNNIAGQTWYEGCGYPKGTRRSAAEGGYYIKYPDPVIGYVNFITSNLKRYGHVKDFKTPLEQFQAIKEGGWATDPFYVSKLTAVWATVKKNKLFEPVKLKVIPKKVSVPVGLVDYLKSKHMPSDFYSRRAMAAKYGIKNYSGQADENIRLMEKLRRDNE
jgi:hypothetical protein